MLHKSNTKRHRNVLEDFWLTKTRIGCLLMRLDFKS
jgi:hypothetical protein